MIDKLLNIMIRFFNYFVGLFARKGYKCDYKNYKIEYANPWKWYLDSYEIKMSRCRRRAKVYIMFTVRGGKRPIIYKRCGWINHENGIEFELAIINRDVESRMYISESEYKLRLVMGAEIYQ